MDRRTFIGSVAGGFLCPAVLAQQTGRVWRIGMLETTSAALNAVNLGAFRQVLKELGYIEGQNLHIEYRSADGRGERFTGFATELVGLQVDFIVTRGTPAVLAAKNATQKLPIVMVSIAEPLAVVATLARPGGNITGLSNQTSDFEAKRIELLRELVPGIARVAFLYNMSNPFYPPRWRELEVVSKSLGIHPQLLDARKPADLERVFDEAGKGRAEGLMVAADALFQANRKLLAELAAKHKLPAIYQSKEFVEAGGLMAYGPSYADLYRRAASYVDKIFKGANPADLPIQQPSKFELIINANAAKALGIKFPPSLLLRADEVIQ